jgi:predicted dehydrogenase
MDLKKEMTRRTFLKSSAAGATALSLGLRATAQALGANDKIRLGFIGVANRGGQLLRSTLRLKDANVEVVALCDVDEPTMLKQEKATRLQSEKFTDFRKMLEKKDMDAVVIATPDHWHAIQTIMACDAGKDVYVEKPLSITVVEGRRMVESVRKNNRVCQVGTQRRSSDLYQRLVEMVRGGKIGRVTVGRAYRLSNMYPTGIGIAPDAEPPEGLDWDMWLGPRPKRLFNENIYPYKFRWWDLYSSQLGNWGVHYLDAMRWVVGEVAPSSVCALGGKYAVKDARTIPDTLEVTYELPSGMLMVFGQYEANGNPALAWGEVELRGTEGTLYATESGFKIIPEKGGQFVESGPRMEPMDGKSSGEDSTDAHIRNFLECMRSRKRPNADVEDGHRSTTFSLLGNISLATRSRIDWDWKHERITRPEEANELLHYRYREPWKLT